MGSSFRKFDDEDFVSARSHFTDEFTKDPDKFRQKIGHQQIALYVMVGGGMIGRSFAEQPKGAYVDSRVGKRPYSMKEIDQARKILVIMAEVAGYDPNGFNNGLPSMPNFHGAGVF